MKRYPIIALFYLGLALVIDYVISTQISDFLGISINPKTLPQCMAVFGGVLAVVGLLLRLLWRSDGDQGPVVKGGAFVTSLRSRAGDRSPLLR